METFRPLLPVGYAAGVDAYRAAVEQLTAKDLSTHYTDGLRFFHEALVPKLKARLEALSGGEFHLDDFVAYGAGSDVDFISHLIEAVAAHEDVQLYPGDWFGFRVGATQQQRIHWTTELGARAGLSCLCIPSVRNGHLTAEMSDFLESSPSCLLNLNLFPTLRPAERRRTAGALAPILNKSILSISFSRGFGLTASQLGVALVHRDHPLRARFEQQWSWHTYFFNAIAARAFLAVDLDRLEGVDALRREWVHGWLRERRLPVVESGSYYVKSFRIQGEVPASHLPLVREGVARLCFKPPQS